MMTSFESIPSDPIAPEVSEAPQTNDESLSTSLQEYRAKLDLLKTPEEKIAFGLEFMKKAISQEGVPCFREFWDARRDLLSLFKQNLNQAIRSKLWGDYVELTVEARRLKEILEEQSSFAIEQIDLAITVFEQGIENFDKLLEPTPQISFPYEARSLQEKVGYYNKIQRELNVLNNLASRLNGLRKEIIKTEMRIRFKTKFFKRLSALGDSIFPRRKLLIEEIGAEFDKDIDNFVQSHFVGQEVVGAPYYALREEIKALQGFAKTITLNTNIFTKTRVKLSECWDQIKVLEKVHKQEFQQKKQVWSDNHAIIATKIEELKKQIEGMDLKTLDAALDEIQKEMNSVELGRDDVRSIRQEFYQLRAPYLEQEEQKRKELDRIEQEKIQLRKEKIANLKERLLLLQKDTEKTVDELNYEFEEIRREIDALSLSKYDLQQFERLYRPMKDLIAERKERAILNLSDNERSALEQLKEVLSERKTRRLEIKNQLEVFRKTLGSSNLDFEKAMNLREQVEQEKENLEKANASILEIESKIAAIEENA